MVTIVHPASSDPAVVARVAKGEDRESILLDMPLSRTSVMCVPVISHSRIPDVLDDAPLAVRGTREEGDRLEAARGPGWAAIDWCFLR